MILIIFHMRLIFKFKEVLALYPHLSEHETLLPQSTTPDQRSEGIETMLNQDFNKEYQSNKV